MTSKVSFFPDHTEPSSWKGLNLLMMILLLGLLAAKAREVSQKRWNTPFRLTFRLSLAVLSLGTAWGVTTGLRMEHWVHMIGFLGIGFIALLIAFVILFALLESWNAFLKRLHNHHGFDARFDKAIEDAVCLLQKDNTSQGNITLLHRHDMCGLLSLPEILIVPAANTSSLEKIEQKTLLGQILTHHGFKACLQRPSWTWARESKHNHNVKRVDIHNEPVSAHRTWMARKALTPSRFLQIT